MINEAEQAKENFFLHIKGAMRAIKAARLFLASNPAIAQAEDGVKLEQTLVSFYQELTMSPAAPPADVDAAQAYLSRKIDIIWDAVRSVIHFVNATPGFERLPHGLELVLALENVERLRALACADLQEAMND